MTRILVAGIGNIFSGDDAFGVEVVRRLMAVPRPTGVTPAGVTIVDFGIRGIDLAYALIDGYDTAILIDAAPHGAVPGTVSIIEPETDEPAMPTPDDATLSGHGLVPVKVLRMANRLGDRCRRIVLVACEPLDCGGDAGRMGLTAPVAAAIEPAMRAVADLIAAYLREEEQAAAAA
jgi:hydrogenase maturation protease